MLHRNTDNIRHHIGELCGVLLITLDCGTLSKKFKFRCIWESTLHGKLLLKQRRIPYCLNFNKCDVYLTW